MLKTRIIPCMTYNGMYLVKTVKFEQMRTLGNPVQIARVYNSRNVDELIFLDLSATEDKRHPDYELITDVMRECFMPVTIGGGIHSVQTISKLLRIGADKISINSEAMKKPEFISEASNKFGSQCIVVSIDSKRYKGDHYVFTNHGTVNTNIRTVEWAKKVAESGAGEILLTSINQDGTLEGFDLELIQKVSAAVSTPVVACGGAGKVQDIIDAVKLGGADAVAVASMFHYSGHTSESIKQRVYKAGIPVRLI